MKKLLATVAAAIVMASTLTVVVEAQQRRGGRGRQQAAAAAPEEAPQSVAIAPAMGELHWGLKKQEVYEYFQRQIREKYRTQLAKAPGAIEEDRIRARMQEELQRLHNDEVCFDNTRTGWDASYIRDEFAHNSNECMLVVNEQDSQNFYFFINDRLWKWYKAFNADVFQGQTFDQFAAAIQGRFGQARDVQGELIQGGGRRHWLEWQDGTTRLRAVDQTQFYGFYCLVFEERQTLGNLATLRRNAPVRQTKTHALVDLVTSQPAASDDSHSDIVDRLTGKNRNPQQAPEDATKNAPSKRTTTTPTPAPAANPNARPEDSLDL